MNRTLKSLSVLLSYPTEEMVAAVPAIREAIAGEGLVPKAEMGPLAALIDSFATGDLYDLQERYVLLFDRTRSLSLHLFEHVHGEGRDRGQAMVDLKMHYAKHGLELGTGELPDFLPLFLEFLSTRPLPEARALLGQPLHVLTALRERLAKRKSPYAAALAALEAIAEADAGDGAETLAEDPDDDPEDLDALDRAWEDQPVTFGPGAAGGVSPGGGCPAARETLARMDTPAKPNPNTPS